MAKTPRVLFVDDNLMLHDVAKSILGQEGDLSIEVAGSGEIALTKMDNTKYDAVITDYEMPGINGVDFIRQARAKGCEAVFIIFTGKGSEEIATDSIVSGAEFYCLKTGDAKSDLEQIKAILRENTSEEEVGVEQGRWHSQLVNRMTEGFAHFQAITDQSGKPTGYMVREINTSFERITGIGRENVVGTRVGESDQSSRDLDDDLLRAFGEITRTGKDVHLEGYSPVLRKWLKVSVFSPEPGQFMAIVDDLEKEKGLEDALRQANRKLNLLGSISRQDMQNQLTAMIGFISVAQNKCESEVTGDFLAKALRSGENIKRILEFTRDYERIGVKGPEWFTLKDALTKALVDMPLDGVQLTIDLDGLEIYSDRLIERVLFHLVDNAKRSGGKVTELHFFYDSSSGGLKLVCEDNGTGIGEETRHQMFDDKYGHSLYLIKEILKVSGMTIEEKGKKGKGARFEISIPRDRFRFNEEQKKERAATLASI